jgi:hypothetical protein
VVGLTNTWPVKSAVCHSLAALALHSLHGSLIVIFLRRKFLINCQNGPHLRNEDGPHGLQSRSLPECPPQSVGLGATKWRDSGHCAVSMCGSFVSLEMTSCRSPASIVMIAGICTIFSRRSDANHAMSKYLLTEATPACKGSAQHSRAYLAGGALAARRKPRL